VLAPAGKIVGAAVVEVVGAAVVGAAVVGAAVVGAAVVGGAVVGGAVVGTGGGVLFNSANSSFKCLYEPNDRVVSKMPLSSQSMDRGS
jgi:hypothetical protein